MSSPHTLYQVTLSYACFSIEVDDRRRVVKAAPIGAWMKGKRVEDVIEWAGRRGGWIRRVEGAGSDE